MTPETQHMLTVLKTAIRVLGYTYNDIAQKLGLSSGYLSRLFSGKIELKFDHIVALSRALGFEPEEIFQLAYPTPKNPPSRTAQRYRALTAGAEPIVPGPTPGAPLSSEEDLERLIANTLRKLLAPPPSPQYSGMPSEEDLEKTMERMLRRFFGNLALTKAE
jgi:transcriptional regulator with XRE-family HTH domain